MPLQAKSVLTMGMKIVAFHPITRFGVAETLNMLLTTFALRIPPPPPLLWAMVVDGPLRLERIAACQVLQTFLA